MFDKVDHVLQSAVDAGDVHGVVATAATREGPVYEGAAGVRVVGGGAMSGDTMFRIASMTKMVATVAALQLAERKDLDLDAPVEAILPAFSRVQVLDGFDGDAPRLRRPATVATVRQLVTHTTGLTYWFWNADVDRWQDIVGNRGVLAGTDESFDAPLVADPGTRFEYGTNTDWLGKVVEAASGATLDVYLAEHILGPLGMHDTTVHMTEEQRARSTPIHVRTDDGIVATDIDWVQEPTYWSGGHCLYSTPRDYLRFQRMLLGGGEVDGVRLLEPDTVEAAFTNQIGELDFPARITTARPDLSADFVAGPGHKWGLGMLLNMQSLPGRRAAGSGAWAGLFNTHFWVDRSTGVTGAVYSQSLPFVEPRVYQMYLDYEHALYDALGPQGS